MSIHIMIRTDHWSSYYNMGNYLLRAGYPKQALESYGIAAQRDPRTPVSPWSTCPWPMPVSADNSNAEKSLRKALKLDPASAAAHLNLGLLYGRAEEDQGGGG